MEDWLEQTPVASGQMWVETTSSKILWAQRMGRSDARSDVERRTSSAKMPMMRPELLSFGSKNEISG